jgi:hypothetical protein
MLCGLTILSASGFLGVRAHTSDPTTSDLKAPTITTLPGERDDQLYATFSHPYAAAAALHDGWPHAR